MCTDFSTISDAYSQDWDCRSIRTQRVARDPPHAAVDVGELAREQPVEDPGRDRRAEVLVQPRHRARLDRSLPARAHHVLVALLEASPRTVSAAGSRRCSRRRPSAPSGRGCTGSHPCRRARAPASAPAGRARRRRGASSGVPIGGGVDDQDLAAHAGGVQTLPAPGDEISDRQLLVERRDDDRQMRARRHRSRVSAVRSLRTRSATVVRFGIGSGSHARIDSRAAGARGRNGQNVGMRSIRALLRPRPRRPARSDTAIAGGPSRRLSRRTAAAERVVRHPDRGGDSDRVRAGAHAALQPAASFRLPARRRVRAVGAHSRSAGT